MFQPELLVSLAFVFFSVKRLLTYMHAYQQEEYDSKRFFCWMAHGRVFDKRLSFVLLVFTVPAVLMPQAEWIYIFLSVAAFAGIALTEADPRRRSKKKLVMTARVKRIYAVAFLMCLMISCPVFALVPAYWIIPVQMIPLTLAAANLLLAPFEALVQRKYWAEAHSKFMEMKPFTIAITGSYGKTSVKHILGHILKSAAPTLITPGSVNTPMGVTRIIREQLEKRHRYFVVEMGAYGPGSIERLCRLTPPDCGIITAVGYSHFERFQSLETVARAKFELAEAVERKGGDSRVIVHADTLAYEKPARMAGKNPGLFVPVGGRGRDEVQVLSIEQTDDGVSTKIRWQEEEYVLKSPLYGEHHGVNMALAFVTAVTIGVPAKHAIMALRTTPQIAHRLEVKPHGDGGVLIDDAFNSNPGGFRSALDLLDRLAKGRRRVLITPGMVELGAEHDKKHAEAGSYAAKKTDVAIAVRPDRIAAFIEAYSKAKKPSQSLVSVAGFAEARMWLEENGRKDDVILLENDLPDIYENLPRI